jgi:hypothetical protein
MSVSDIIITIFCILDKLRGRNFKGDDKCEKVCY